MSSLSLQAISCAFLCVSAAGSADAETVQVAGMAVNLKEAAHPPILSQSSSGDESTLTFLAIGDWGKDPNSTAEIEVARGMGSIADQLNAEFVALLGDNFYDSGIHGDETSSRFQDTFESVFTGEALRNIPFYAIAGNHDHEGNVTAQIEYSKRSQRWTYPAPWYSVKRTFGTGESSGTVELFFIDTVVFVGVCRDPTPLETGTVYPGAPDPRAYESQMAWLENGLESSTADYLFVAGHYPVYSIGTHGPTLKLKLALEPLLDKYDAHYMCGHDHDMEHIQLDGKKWNHVLSGAGGAGCCYSAKNIDKVPASAIKFAAVGTNGSAYQPMPFPLLGGFVAFELSTETFEIVYYSHNATELWRTDPIARREASVNKGGL